VVEDTLDARRITECYTQNGERIASKSYVRKYKSDMISKGIPVIVDKKWKILPNSVAAGFDFSNGTIVIRKDPTLISLDHEGYHAEQYLKLGQEEYILQGKITREGYVYDRIMENENLYNVAEITQSTNYIQDVRTGMYGN